LFRAIKSTTGQPSAVTQALGHLCYGRRSSPRLVQWCCHACVQFRFDRCQTSTWL